MTEYETKSLAFLERIATALEKGGTRSMSSAGSTGGGLTFPPYGRAKGLPVHGASMNDLKFYAQGCERTLNDESKSRWHEKERALLAAIHAEMRRQGHAPDYDDRGQPPPGDDFPDHMPPPGDEDAPF